MKRQNNQASQSNQRCGIVATAGHSHIEGLRWSLHRIRSLGGSLPMEVWLEPGVLGGGNWPANVTFKRFQTSLQVGFARKIESILASRFSKVLFVDADVWFVLNPQELISSPLFEKLGYLLWPDLPGKNCMGWQSTDSGVMLWDKTRHLELLRKALAVTLATHSSEAEGDKESYALAHGSALTHVSDCPDFAGFLETDANRTWVRGCAMLQFYQDKMAFCHSTLFKYGLHEKLHDGLTWKYRFSSKEGWDHRHSALYGRWFPSIQLQESTVDINLDFNLR